MVSDDHPMISSLCDIIVEEERRNKQKSKAAAGKSNVDKEKWKAEVIKLW